VGPGCVMDYEYLQYFFLILIVLAAGLLFYLVRWVVQVLTRAWKLRRIDAAIEKLAAGGRGHMDQGRGDDLAIQELQTEVEHRNRMNYIVYGAMSWLDACYIGVAVRVLPVFVPSRCCTAYTSGTPPPCPCPRGRRGGAVALRPPWRRDAGSVSYSRVLLWTLPGNCPAAGLGAHDTHFRYSSVSPLASAGVCACSRPWAESTETLLSGGAVGFRCWVWQVGDTTVMYWAPQIEWFSPTHLTLFIPALIMTGLYLLGMPAGVRGARCSWPRSRRPSTPRLPGALRVPHLQVQAPILLVRPRCAAPIAPALRACLEGPSCPLCLCAGSYTPLKDREDALRLLTAVRAAACCSARTVPCWGMVPLQVVLCNCHVAHRVRVHRHLPRRLPQRPGTPSPHPDFTAKGGLQGALSAGIAWPFKQAWPSPGAPLHAQTRLRRAQHHVVFVLPRGREHCWPPGEHRVAMNECLCSACRSFS